MIDVPVRVKDALRDGRLKKNYRFVVLNEDGTESEIGTIDNNNLVSESVSIDERMCSGDTLKFGLCEGSSLEFQYFGKPNITGKRVQAFIDVDYGEAEPYTIPMGFFDVKKCSRQASTGIIKVTAYNKLQSTYLDAKANDLLIEAYDSIVSAGYYSATIDSMAREVFQGYSVKDAGTLPLRVQRPIYLYQTGTSYDVEETDENGTPTGYYLHLLCPWVVYMAEDPDALLPNRLDYNYGVYSVEVNVSAIKEAMLADLDYQDKYCLDRGVEVITFTEFIERIYKEHTDFLFYVGNSSELISFDAWQYTKLNTGFFGNVKLSESSGTGYYYAFTWVPGLAIRNTSSSSPLIAEPERIVEAATYAIEYCKAGNPTLYKQERTQLGSQISDPRTWADISLRELQSALYEVECQYGQLDRQTDLFNGVELNRSALYPADTLYPENSLYPDGAQASSFRSQYSKLWADEGNVHKWRNLIITYKGLDENQQPKDFTLQRQVNADGTDDYNCSDNWLFRNLIWTSEQIAQYADVMVAKMQPITWFPFEMWGAGLPYIETGDQIEIPLGEETYTSYILQRNLKGIQNLQDTYINGTLDIF